MHGTHNLTASCPECQNDLSFNRLPQLGDFVFCPECETTSEVIEVEPIKLDWHFEEPFNEDEDYDDDYDDEDYDDSDDDDDDYDDEDYDDSEDDDYEDDSEDDDYEDEDEDEDYDENYDDD